MSEESADSGPIRPHPDHLSPPSREQSGLGRAAFLANRASSLAFQFVIPPAIGIWIDHSQNSSPWGVVIGAVIGFALGISQLFHLVKQMDAENERQKQLRKRQQTPNSRSH